LFLEFEYKELNLVWQFHSSSYLQHSEIIFLGHFSLMEDEGWLAQGQVTEVGG